MVNKIMNNPKIIRSWCMYDWANSVYNLVITSTIFPAYYEGVLPKEIVFCGRTFVNTALYNYTLAFAFFMVAICSPIFSAIADSKGNKKRFLQFFATLGSCSCAGLYFFSANHIYIGFAFLILACFGFWSSLVFYNSYLPEIASMDKRDSVSAKGFTFGYIGSVTLQLLCFVIIFNKSFFGILPQDQTTAPRICFIMVGIWWFGFSLIPLFHLPAGTPNKVGISSNFLKSGFLTLKNVWLELNHLKAVRKYLIGFFFYNMGVQTIMLVAVLFAKKELHMETQALIITVLIIQLVAIAGAYCMAKSSEKYGNIKTILVVLIIWILICVAAYLVNSQLQFFALAGMVGFVMGGIQSLSRSTYAKLIPTTHDTASYFSFFDVTEKVAIAIGLLSYGLIEEITGTMRNSLAVLILYFVLGFVILFSIRKKI